MGFLEEQYLNYDADDEQQELWEHEMPAIRPSNFRFLLLAEHLPSPASPY